MIKRKIAAALLVTATLSMPGPAMAHHGTPIYDTYYYSDATYTQEVGYDPVDCCYFGPCYSHTGQSSNYVQYVHVGYCADDGGIPYREPL